MQTTAGVLLVHLLSEFGNEQRKAAGTIFSGLCLISPQIGLELVVDVCRFQNLIGCQLYDGESSRLRLSIPSLRARCVTPAPEQFMGPSLLMQVCVVMHQQIMRKRTIDEALINA